MRLARFLNEEDVIKKGLSVMEPEVGEKYSDEEVKEYISTVKDAIAAQKKEDMNDAAKAILKDLEDKLDKWENVDIETKATGPVVPAVDILAAIPPEAAGEEAPPEGEEEEAPKEEPKKDKEKEKKKKDKKKESDE